MLGEWLEVECPWKTGKYTFASIFGYTSEYLNHQLISDKIFEACVELNSQLINDDKRELLFERMVELDKPFLELVKNIRCGPLEGDVVDAYEYNCVYFWNDIWKVMFFYYQKNNKILESLRNLIDRNLPSTWSHEDLLM